MTSALADLLLLVHLGFVLFVVFGGLLVLRRPALALLHLPALAWGLYVEISGTICPLTPLEGSLRGRSPAAGGPDFVERLVVPVLYPPGLRPEHQWLLAALLGAFNLAVYLGVVRRWRAGATGTTPRFPAGSKR